MTRTAPEWLEPSAPWNAAVPAATCAALSLAPSDIPIVELPSAPLSALELIAIRHGRYVPWFGRGALRDEAVRILANVVRALGNAPDPRGTEHALALAQHPALGLKPWRSVIHAAAQDTAALQCIDVAMCALGLLGASDVQREQFARELVSVPTRHDAAILAMCAGGGDLGTFRDHYGLIVTSRLKSGASLTVLRGFFDFVLARRFSGLDALHIATDASSGELDAMWLIAAADLVAGDPRAHIRMTDLAQQMLSPVSTQLPRLMTLVAREMNSLVGHPLRTRMLHLRCAAARDHAAAAIRAWLTAASESHDDTHEHDETPLGPEPSRAGRAAIIARDHTGEFLLDWFVPDRVAREALDQFARSVLRLYHRMRGALLFQRLCTELAPASSASLSREERIVWGSR